MSLQHNSAAVVGFTEDAARKVSSKPRFTSLELAADLAVRALADAGLSLRDVNGISVCGVDETQWFAPATVAEYLGVEPSFADAVDLGGASPAAMIWRAASAVEKQIADVIICLTPGLPLLHHELRQFGASSYRPGSPQAEFDIPYGHLGQNALYAMVAQRYAHCYGYDPSALARLVVHQRINACATPGAIFYGRPLTEADVLNSKMIARPLRLLEIVMPVMGGAAVVVASAEIARRCPHRPVWITGYGESISHKSPQHAADLLKPPIDRAAKRAFTMAGISTGDVDVTQLYDCYSITVALALEAAGFCSSGESMDFIRQHDLTYRGDFPLNTNGGQLGYGQAGFAGGMGHVVEAARQVSRRAGGRQVPGTETAFVMGNGGIMSEQVALIMQGG